MIMNDKVYDTLKFVALLILPIGTFISTFFNIWGIGYTEQTQQTFIALDVLVGAFVTISNQVYKNQNTVDTTSTK